MQLKKYTLLLLTSLALVACLKEEPFTSDSPTPSDGPVTVGFWMGNGNPDGNPNTPDGNPDDTRTSINEDGRTVSWSSGDKVALWAKVKDGTDFTFSNQTFTHWFTSANNSQAFFTTTLGSAMPDKNTDDSNITYTYYATYPVPSSVSGTTATFTIPSTQDGKMGGGADIMVAQSEGSALTTLDEDEDFVIDRPDGYPSFTMKHLIHALRFYVPAGNWGFPAGETIERIVFTMPSAAAGTASVDIAAANPALGSLSGGSNTIALNLIDPIGASTADSNGNITYDYAVAAIMPPSITFGNDDKMIVKVYSQTKAAQQEISLSGRGAGAENDKMQMAAGHVTPVALNCSTTTDRPKISFRIESNNLGEQPYKITLTSADISTKWKDGDDHIYEYYTGSESSTIAVSGGFDIYYDEETLSTISGKSVTVTYESASAIVTKNITMPSMSVGTSYNISLNVPYLLEQNFNNIASTNNEVENTTGAALDNYGLVGWSGNCWATDKVFRLATYVGTTAGGGTNVKFSRVDTPQLYGIKDGKTVKVRVSFDLGLTRISGSGVFTGKWDIQARCYFGTTPYDESNPYPNGGAISIAGQGNGINKPNTIIATITDSTMSDFNASSMKSYSYNIDCKTTTRLSWVNDYLCHSGSPADKTVYTYIDNIKVQIVP